MQPIRAHVIDWLNAHIGSLCFAELTTAGAVIATIRGTLLEPTQRGHADAYFEIDDGRRHLGIGQPGFVVPSRITDAITIDDAAVRFSYESPDIQIRVITAIQDPTTRGVAL